MLFPFRTSTIFKNRWVALMWAAGICFMAAQIVDSVSGVTTKKGDTTAVTPADAPSSSTGDPVAVALGNAPPPTSSPAMPPPPQEHIAR